MTAFVAPKSTEISLDWALTPGRELVRLAWPIVVSLASFSVMTAVDTAFVGRLGASALAAVGVGGTLVFCVSSFGVAVLSAAKVRVGQCLGARDSEGVKALLGAFLRLASVLGVLSALVGALVAQGLWYVHVDPIAAGLSVKYATLSSASLPLSLLSAAIGQWRQGLGDSRAAMRAALVANIVNVPLNAVFIFLFGFGTAGAAAATWVARLVELVWLLSGQWRQGLYWNRTDARQAVRILRMGLTTGLERLFDLSAFLMLAVLLARVSPVELGAHQIALQVAHFCFLPLIALSEAISVLVAQARGARSPELVRRIVRWGLVLALGSSSLSALVLTTARSSLLRLFTTDLEIIASGSGVLLVGALLQWLCAPYNVLKGLLRGASDFTVVAWVAVGCAWLFGPPLTWLFGWQLGYGAKGAWAALCVEVLVGTLLLTLRVWRFPRSIA